MGLPFRRQPLGDLLQAHEVTYRQAARALKCNEGRINNMVAGRVYPTAVEIDALEELIGLPIQTMFDNEVLKFYSIYGSRHTREGRAARAASAAQGSDQ